jgi:hypothetical protein
MNRLITIVLIIFSLSSCQNYDSEKYIKIENEAIEDIILEMTNFEEMQNLNEWKNEKLKLYISSKLETTSEKIIKPTGYDISSNGIDYSKEKIAENKREFESNLAEYNRENQLFINLNNGKIEVRILNYTFFIEKLKIELIGEIEIEKLKIAENEFGQLYISRIIFNRNYTKGYLSFNFFCQDMCGWGENIEIIKNDGKWRISEHFSGWII